MSRTWSDRGGHSLEPRQAERLGADDGFLGPLGTATVVAANRPGFSNQLGRRLQFRGVVRAVRPGAPATGIGEIYRG